MPKDYPVVVVVVVVVVTVTAGVTQASVRSESYHFRATDDVGSRVRQGRGDGGGLGKTGSTGVREGRGNGEARV